MMGEKICRLIKTIIHELKSQLWDVMNPIENDERRMTQGTWISHGAHVLYVMGHMGSFSLFHELSLSHSSLWWESIASTSQAAWPSLEPGVKGGFGFTLTFSEPERNYIYISPEF